MTIEAQITKLQDEITDIRRNLYTNFFAAGLAMGEISKKIDYLIQKEKERVEKENAK